MKDVCAVFTPSRDLEQRQANSEMVDCLELFAGQARVSEAFAKKRRGVLQPRDIRFGTTLERARWGPRYCMRSRPNDLAWYGWLHRALIGVGSHVSILAPRNDDDFERKNKCSYSLSTRWLKRRTSWGAWPSWRTQEAVTCGDTPPSNVGSWSPTFTWPKSTCAPMAWSAVIMQYLCGNHFLFFATMGVLPSTSPSFAITAMNIRRSKAMRPPNRPSTPLRLQMRWSGPTMQVERPSSKRFWWPARWLRTWHLKSLRAPTPSPSKARSIQQWPAHWSAYTRILAIPTTGIWSSICALAEHQPAFSEQLNKCPAGHVTAAAKPSCSGWPLQSLCWTSTRQLQQTSFGSMLQMRRTSRASTWST